MWNYQIPDLKKFQRLPYLHIPELDTHPNTVSGQEIHPFQNLQKCVWKYAQYEISIHLTSYAQRHTFINERMCTKILPFGSFLKVLPSSNYNCYKLSFEVTFQGLTVPSSIKGRIMLAWWSSKDLIKTPRFLISNVMQFIFCN